MRVLINRESDVRGDDLDNELLEAIYRPSREPWFRANMMSTVDGAATRDTGATGSINNEPDKRVYDVLRRQADAVVVGAAGRRGSRVTAPPTVRSSS